MITIIIDPVWGQIQRVNPWNSIEESLYAYGGDEPPRFPVPAIAVTVDWYPANGPIPGCVVVCEYNKDSDGEIKCVWETPSVWEQKNLDEWGRRQ
jgi:hypothetical protein